MIAANHLRPEDQRVVGVLVREVHAGRGIGASFEPVPGTLALQGGVTVRSLERVRPFEENDLHALGEELGRSYPDQRSILSTRSEAKAAGGR